MPQFSPQSEIKSKSRGNVICSKKQTSEENHLFKEGDSTKDAPNGFAAPPLHLKTQNDRIAYSKEPNGLSKLTKKKLSLPRKRLMSENIHNNSKPSIDRPRELKFLKKQKIVSEVKRAKRRTGKRKAYLEDPIQGMIG